VGGDIVGWRACSPSLVEGCPTNSPDLAIFDYALQNNWVLITNDLDFPQILANSRTSKSLSVCATPRYASLVAHDYLKKLDLRRSVHKPKKLDPVQHLKTVMSRP